MTAKRVLVVVAGLLALAVLTVGAIRILVDGPAEVRDGDGVQRRPASGEVTVSYPEEPRSLNPYLMEGDTNATRDLLRPVLPTLLRVTPSLRYEPALATKVPGGRDVGGEPFSVTFRLDPKAVWSDGKPITAADVRFTWETLLDPRWPIADRSAYQKVKDVVVVGPRTVKLVFDQVYRSWRDLFSAGDFILPKHLLEGQDLTHHLRVGPTVSGGPFLIEKYTPGLEIVYVPNPRWWGPPAQIARVRLVFVPELETALELMKRDRVTVVSASTQVSLTERLQVAGATDVKSRYGSCWWELVFNMDRPGIKERAFREAVSRAIDRPGFVEALVQDEGRELHHLMPGRRVAGDFQGFTKDVEVVKRLLAAPGGRPGSRPSISAAASNELGTLLGRLVQKGMIDAGLMLELVNTEADRLYGEWRSQGEFDLAVVERRGTPDRALTSDHRSDLKPPAGTNYSRVASADLDRALEGAETSTAGIAQVNARLAAELPVLPLLECKAFLGGKGVRGLDPNATVEGPFWNLEEWRLSA